MHSDISFVSDPRDLAARCIGAVVSWHEDGFTEAGEAFNLAVDLRPQAVAFPHDADDVAAVVSYARERDMRVAVQGRGHRAAALAPLEGHILLRTSQLTGVDIDPVRRRARVQAGATWEQLALAAREHGLAAPAGSSPSAGVVGECLGGGLGWQSRRNGLLCSAVTAIELLTADGLLLRTDAHREPDLFWALRGGGGNFGVVTAMELALTPVTTAIAGALVWDWRDAERVLDRWATWALDAPDEITTAARIVRLPGSRCVPQAMRGHRVVMIEGAFSGATGAAHAALAPLRALRPEVDTFAPMPTAALMHLRSEMGAADAPQATVGDHALLDGLTAAAVSALVAVAVPGSKAPLTAELHQLGGALRRVAPERGALATIDAAFALVATGAAADAGTRDSMAAHARRVTEVMRPWSSGRSCLNFAGRPTDARTAFDAASYARLQAIRARVDPDGLFIANHPIDVTPLGTTGTPSPCP